MKVVTVAKKYIFQKELPDNKFEKTSPLGKLLHDAGQKDGEAWCCYFMEGVFCEAYPEQNKYLRKLFSASAVKTYDNFKSEGYDCHAEPRLGDLVIWQKYAGGIKQWQGHAGIVIDVLPDGAFKTIEGNTNSYGSREGDGVMEKVRKITFKNDGLNLLGFVTVSKDFMKC